MAWYGLFVCAVMGRCGLFGHGKYGALRANVMKLSIPWAVISHCLSDKTVV